MVSTVAIYWKPDDSHNLAHGIRARSLGQTIDLYRPGKSVCSPIGQASGVDRRCLGYILRLVVPSFAMKPAFVLIPALIVLAACSRTQGPAVHSQEGDLKSLRAAQQTAIALFASKSADQMASAYSPDASLMFPNSPLLHGQDLRTAMKALAADPNFSMQFTTDSAVVAKSGEVGYTRGTYTMTMSDPKTTKPLREKGKYVTIYARQPDGNWKIIEDISNADAPPIPVALHNH